MDNPNPLIDLTAELDMLAAVRAILDRKLRQVTDPAFNTAIDNSVYHLGVVISMLEDPLMRPKPPAPRPTLKPMKR